MVETTVKITKYQLYDILKNYYWMIKEIQRIDSYLDETDYSGAAQYGLEATMPKAQGIVGKALENEVIRRVEKSKRLKRYIEEVNFINQNKHKVAGDREEVVLDCLLDGLSLIAISKHLGISRQHVADIRERIIIQLLGE